MGKNDKKTNIQDLKEVIKKFRDDRDWQKFHNPKDIAEAISIEASELLQLFLWKNKEEIKEKMEFNAGFFEEIKKELADVVIFCINFANTTGIDITEAVLKKINNNNEKYSIDKSKGRADKYNKL